MLLIPVYEALCRFTEPQEEPPRTERRPNGEEEKFLREYRNFLQYDGTEQEE